MHPAVTVTIINDYARLPPKTEAFVLSIEILKRFLERTNPLQTINFWHGFGVYNNNKL
jgi:hypothetical protein